MARWGCSRWPSGSPRPAARLTGRHEQGYAWAGEAVELGRELGHVADLAMAHELLAREEAGRGAHDRAALELEAAHACEREAGTLDVAVVLPLTDAWCALCRGDLPRVVAVLEERLRADGGRQPRGDYPLSVVPDLVEAHLGLGARDRAAELAREHAQLHSEGPDPVARAHVQRLRGLLLADDDEADAAFALALTEHARGGDPVEAARTRLLRGRRARRAGRRRSARQELRAAADAFAAMGLDGWRRRAEEELAVLGAAPQRAGGDRGRAHLPGDPGRAARRPGPEQPGHRGDAVPQPQDRRAPRDERAAQARRPVPHGARAGRWRGGRAGPSGRLRRRAETGPRSGGRRPRARVRRSHHSPTKGRTSGISR